MVKLTINRGRGKRDDSNYDWWYWKCSGCGDEPMWFLNEEAMKSSSQLHAAKHKNGDI